MKSSSAAHAVEVIIPGESTVTQESCFPLNGQMANWRSRKSILESYHGVPLASLSNALQAHNQKPQVFPGVVLGKNKKIRSVAELECRQDTKGINGEKQSLFLFLNVLTVVPH